MKRENVTKAVPMIDELATYEKMLQLSTKGNEPVVSLAVVNGYTESKIKIKPNKAFVDYISNQIKDLSKRLEALGVEV